MTRRSCAWCRGQVEGHRLTCSDPCRSQLSRARRCFRQVASGGVPERPIPPWLWRAVGARLTAWAVVDAVEGQPHAPEVEAAAVVMMATGASEPARWAAAFRVGQLARLDHGVSMALRAAIRWAHQARTGRTVWPHRQGAA